MCNFYEDCDDGSDESLSLCNHKWCPRNYFWCKLSGKCLPPEFQCDGTVNCDYDQFHNLDTSDEDSAICNRTSRMAFKCPNNYARCGNLFECIPVQQFCDGIGDCPDNSDELKFCEITNQCQSKKCSHHCKQTAEGPKCYCPVGQQPSGVHCLSTIYF